MSNSSHYSPKKYYASSQYVILENIEESSFLYIETDSSMKARSLEDAEQRSLLRFRRKIMYNFNVGNVKLRSFWTLTFDEEHIDNAKQIRKFFNRMKTYYRKKAHERGEKLLFSYFWRMEYGEKTGRKHFHFMTSAPYLPYNLVLKWWGQGKVWYKKMDNSKKVVSYITKYTTKVGKTRPLTSTERRFGCSRDFKKVPSTGKYRYLGHISGSELNDRLYFNEPETCLSEVELDELVSQLMTSI
jgi:hypothetical protein